jgi:hypothetical protein
MAKQTFSVGQVLTAAQMTSLQQTAMLGGAASNKTASYTLVAADAGTAISMTSTSATTITVNTGLFAAGDTVQITNLGTGVCTITAGTATVDTAATLALAQYESGTLDFTSTSAAIFIKAAGAAATPAASRTYAIFQDAKAVNTAGGTFTSGAWRTRDLQTTQVNSISGCSLASNQITLPAGTYYAMATTPSRAVQRNYSRLYNITNSATLIAGSISYSGDPSIQVEEPINVITGVFTITGTKVIELQHYSNGTKNGDGFGSSDGGALDGVQLNIYSQITIEKIG